MPTWSTACLDWKRRIRERRSLVPFSPLFPASADAKMAVFTSLRIVDLPGRPTFGEASEEWLLDFAAAIFGAYDDERGIQMITEFFLLISKKNTKSTFAAGILLTELICGWREEDENLILAPTIEVAGNSSKPAAAMVRADDELMDLLHIQEHLRLITHRVTKATLKVVAADAATVGGKKASRVLVDELWLFGKQADADAMFREATGGQISRPEGYTLYLTTQSDEPPAGVFKDKLGYARDVRDGKIVDPKFLPVLYEHPEEMVEDESYLDPANFYVTNPNMGRSVSQEWLEREYGKVEHALDGSKNVFLAKHLNKEIGQNLRNDAWAGARYWKQAAREELRSLDALLARCDVAVVGIDGGGLDDLLGLVVMGRERGTGHLLVWAHAWAHKDVLDRRKDIVSELRGFQKDGDLTICETPTQDVEEVADIVVKVRDSGLMPEVAGVGVDAVGIASITLELALRGVAGNQVVAVAQGYKLSGMVEGVPRQLKDGTILHGGTALLAWSVGNVKIEVRGSAMLMTKQVAGRAKIDVVAAMMNAAMLMSRNPEAAGDQEPFLIII